MAKQQELVVRDEQPVAVEPRGKDIYAAVMSAAVKPDTTPEQIREYLAVAREMKADHDKQQFVAALHAAQSELDGYRIQKRGKIAYRDGSVVRYAKYDDLATAVKPVLRKHGLTESFTYRTLENPPKVVCIMRLTHADGHSETFETVPMPMIDSSGGKTDVQGAGSISSYGQRFALAKALNIITEDEDDDGTGQGVADKITDEQALAIEEYLEQREEQKKGSKVRFFKWLALNCKVDDIRDLSQGPQYETVMATLRSAGEKK